MKLCADLNLNSGNFSVIGTQKKKIGKNPGIIAAVLTVAAVLTFAFATTVKVSDAEEGLALAARSGSERLLRLTSAQRTATLVGAYPSDPSAYFRDLQNVRRQVAQGECSNALPSLNKLVDQYSDDGSVWLLRGHCQMDQKRWQAAIPSLEKALEIGAFPFDIAQVSPNPNDTMVLVAKAYAQLGNNDAAISWLRKALYNRFDERFTLAGDPLLEPLRQDARFAAIAGTGSTGAGWQSDLDFLRSEIERLHIDSELNISSADLENRFENLSHRIAELSDAEITAEIGSILGLLGNGHNMVLPFLSSHSGMHRIPFTLYDFSDGLYVIDTEEGYEEWIGSRIDGFDETTTTDALKLLNTYIAADNSQGRRWIAAYYLAIPHVLANTDIISNANDFVLQLTGRDGQSSKIKPARVPFSLNTYALRPLKNETLTPLYLKKFGETLWSETLEHHGAGVFYMRVNDIQDHQSKSLSNYVEESQITIEKNLSDYLILDLRHNAGGNGYLSMPLAKLAAWFESSRGSGSVFVLIGRNTFSAAHNLIVDIDRMTDAVFVGEPAGSNPNAIAESGYFVLPWSGLMGFISSQYHQHSWPEDHRLWIAPDVPVALSSTQYFSGEDPSMNAILKIIALEEGEK